MISEVSCDNEDWHNNAGNSALILHTNFILKYIKIGNNYSNYISKYYCFTVFLIK